MELVKLFPTVQIDTQSVQTFKKKVNAVNLKTNPEMRRAIAATAPAYSAIRDEEGSILYNFSRYPFGHKDLAKADVDAKLAIGIDPYSILMEEQSGNAASLMALDVATQITTASNYATANKTTITGVTAATEFSKYIEAGLEALRKSFTWGDGLPLTVVVGYDAAVFITKTNAFKSSVLNQYKSQDNPIGAVEAYVKQFVPAANVVIPNHMYVNASGDAVRSVTNQIALIPTGPTSFGKLVIPRGTLPGATGLGSVFEAGENPLEGATGFRYWAAVWYNAKLAVETGATESTAGYLMHSIAA